MPGHADDRSAGLGVVRNDDQDVDVLLVEETFGLFGLYSIIAVGGPDQDIGAKLFGMRLQDVAVILPALFLKGIERESYPDWTWLAIPAGGLIVFGWAGASAEQNAAKRDRYRLCQIRFTHFSTPTGKRLMPGFGLQTRAHPVRQSCSGAQVVLTSSFESGHGVK